MSQKSGAAARPDSLFKLQFPTRPKESKLLLDIAGNLLRKVFYRGGVGSLFGRAAFALPVTAFYSMKRFRLENLENALKLFEEILRHIEYRSRRKFPREIQESDIGENISFFTVT